MSESLNNIDIQDLYNKISRQIKLIFLFLMKHSFMFFLSVIYFCIVVQLVNHRLVFIFDNTFLEVSLYILMGLILAWELLYLTEKEVDLRKKSTISVLLLIIVGCETDELIKLMLLVYILLIGCFIAKYNNKRLIGIAILIFGCFENTWILAPVYYDILKRIIIIVELSLFIIEKKEYGKKYNIFLVLYWMIVSARSVEASVCFLLYVVICVSVHKNEKVQNLREIAYYIHNNLIIMLLGMIYVLFYERMPYILNEKGGYEVSQYYMDYIHFGFGQRGLVGTVVYYLFGYYIPLKKMNHIDIAGTVISLFIIILTLWRMVDLRNRRESMRLILCTAWLVSPAMRLYYSGVGSFDVYNITVVLACVYYVCSNVKHRWIIPILCIIGVMIHPAFIFTCFPSLFIVMIAQIILDYNSRIGIRKELLLYCTTCIMVAGFSVYFMFISSSKLIGDYDRAKAIINERIGYDNSFYYTLFQNVLFTNTNAHLHRFITKDVSLESIQLILFLVKISPLLLFLFLFTRTVSKHISGNAAKKIFQYLPVIIFVIIPLYYLELDDGRWSAFIIDMAFIVILGIDISQEKHGLQIHSRWEYYYIWCYVILFSQYILGDLGLFL